MSVEDQKKRTLEALERRFVVAKAELLQQEEQQNRKKKRVECEEDGRVVRGMESPSTTVSGHNIDAFIKPFFNSLCKKDVEADGPAYTKFFHAVDGNLLTTNPKISSRKGSMVDKILHELLENGDSAQKYMQGSRSMKIDNWLLLDNYVHGRGASGARVRALQSQSKRSKKHMSMKQHKKCGSFELPSEFHRYEAFMPMNEMWKSYIMQLLKTVGRNQLAQCLLNADLHGAIVIVAQCKIATFVGVTGVMIRETAETFEIITADDKFRVVPKKGSVFILQADCWKITLLGDNLSSRNVNL